MKPRAKRPWRFSTAASDTLDYSSAVLRGTSCALSCLLEASTAPSCFNDFLCAARAPSVDAQDATWPNYCFLASSRAAFLEGATVAAVAPSEGVPGVVST